MIPIPYVYVNEAELLDVALFGKTAKKRRDDEVNAYQLPNKKR